MSVLLRVGGPRRPLRHYGRQGPRTVRNRNP